MSLLFSELSHRNHNAAESEERSCVGKYHQVIEHIGKLPNEVVLEYGTEEHEHDCNNRVNQSGLLSEEACEVYLTEVVPGKNGRECEEEETDRNEDRTDNISCRITEDNRKGVLECRLYHICLCNALNCTCGGDGSVVVESGDYDKISQYVDLEYLAICEAVGYVVGNPDSMRYNTNNYMVYIRRTDGKLVFIPIDSDRCFGITKDWNVKSGMTSCGMLDRKNSNNNDTISLLLNTVLANTTNDCQKLYLEFCQTIKESDWAKNETFEKYYNIAKSTYSELSFSTSGDSNNMSFKDYMSKKMSMIGEIDTSFNIYLAGDFNGWSGKDYKMSTTDEVTYSITINVEKNYIQSDSKGNYYKFKFSDGSFTTIDWTLSSDLKTVIKNANGVSSARCYGVKAGDTITITIN